MKNTDHMNILNNFLLAKKPKEFESMLNKMKQIKSVKYNFPIENINDVNQFLNKQINMSNAMNINPDYHKRIFIGGYLSPLPLKYNNIQVRKSNIHGNGLFATADIPANVIITFYPVHALNINQHIYAEDYGDKDFLTKTNMESCCRTHSYYISLIDGLSIVGNPNDTTNPLLLGHMINDGVGNVFSDTDLNETKDLIVFKNLCAKYYIEGLQKTNCKFEIDDNKTVVSIITTKNISADEELLTLYDPMYWFNINYGMNNSNENHGLKHMGVLSRDKKFMSWMKNYIII